MFGPQHPQSGSNESGSTSAAARKGPLGHPGVLLLAGTVVLLGAYALGYLPQFGSLLQDAIRSSQSSDVPVLSPAFYGITGLAAFLMLLGLLRAFDLLLRQFRDTSQLKSRPAKPVEQFIEEAAAANIGLRVAREGYYLLEPQYPHRMCIDLNDDLREDLRLPDEAIRALDALLRTRCDRRQAPVAPPATGPVVSAAPSAHALATVSDLLETVEAAPPLREDRSGSRERAAAGTVLTPSRQRRLSDSAQRKALHAATLSAIETGSLHAPDASGLHRRISDYTGPRRRATDNRAIPEYKGPYQRATDGRPDRPQPSVPERKAQPTSDTAKMYPRDPVFASPLIKRTPEPTR
jgi:hypothetical protein